MPRHDARIVIAGIVKNRERAIRNSRRIVERMGALFRDYRVVIIENDSVDRTPQLLREWAASNSKVRALTLNLNQTQVPGRVLSVVARVRNLYLDILDQEPEHYGDFDLLAVLDMDLSSVDLGGVAATARWADQLAASGVRWGGIAANGVTADGHYYDIFAYRHPRTLVWPPERTALFGRSDGQEIIKAHQKSMVLDPFSKPFQVHSAFSGLSLYNRTLIGKCRYSSPFADCEHVAFHKCLRSSGQNTTIWVAPRMIVEYELQTKDFHRVKTKTDVRLSEMTSHCARKAALTLEGSCGAKERPSLSSIATPA